MGHVFRCLQSNPIHGGTGRYNDGRTGLLFLRNFIPEMMPDVGDIFALGILLVRALLKGVRHMVVAQVGGPLE